MKDIKNFKITKENSIEIDFASPNDPNFYIPKNRQYKADIVRKILGNKNICLRCHSLHVINDIECQKCGAETIRYDSGIIIDLVHSSIRRLRAGLPGDTQQLHYYSMIGSLKEKLQHYQEYQKENMFVGYNQGQKGFNYLYPVHIWDLERFFLIGVTLWFYLYNKELGTFIGMERYENKHEIPIPRKDPNLKDYFKYDFFLQSGYHHQSKKEVLILSRDESLLTTLDNVISLNKKLKYEDKNIDIKPYSSLHAGFESAEWYLFFNLDDNIIIIPQEKSKLDIRDIDELIHLMELDKISRDFKIKRSWREWDVDEIN